MIGKPIMSRRFAASLGVALVASFCLVLPACGGGGEEYPLAVRQNFMNACTSQVGASYSYCSCALAEIQKRFDLEEYLRLELRMLNTGQLPEELAGVISKCIE